MIDAVERLIEQEALFASGERVVIGASGGADSTALVYALHFLRDRLGISLQLAHLHHGIRGAAADRDQREVESLGARLGLNVACSRRDVPRLAAARGVSVEMAARAERLEFFKDTLAATGADTVALAHNLDDQAETILMRLLRGAGRTGLSGISPLQRLDGLTIAHPMLAVTHRAAVQFLRVHGLSWREDASNTSSDYLRNRIRHRILPLLEDGINPNLRATLARTADILRPEEEFMNQAALQLLTNCRDGDGVGLDAARLARVPLALQRRVLLHWFYECGIPAANIGFESVSAVFGMLSDLRGSSRMDLGGGWRVQREYKRLSLHRTETQTDLPPACRIQVPGKTDCPRFGLSVHVECGSGIERELGGRPGHLPSACSISAVKLGDRPLELRTWRPGDRMRPYGMEGSRKLQDIFADCKVPVSERDRIPIFESRGEILWIPGYRIAHDWAVEDGEVQILRISVDRM